MDDSLAIRLRDNLEFYAEAALKVRAKSGDIVPFIFNDAQRFVDAELEKQRAEKGWVRALILKGRQQGISTYVAARYYRRATLWKGINVYILSHEQASADNLFDIVDRYQRNNPIPPHVGAANAKELVFDKLESSYTVATAGAVAGGRGRSTSLFHGSEVAYWKNAIDHFAASVQNVPLLPGTEIILESTSAGSSGEFYQRCSEAIAGRGDYKLIFIPWWFSREYSRDPEAGFTLQNEPDEPDEMSEQEYADRFKLSLPQMAWRRGQIQTLRSATAFRREYPAYVAEAWTSPDGSEPFILPITVRRARDRKTEGVGPLILGVDPASMGGDRFSVAARRGLCVPWVRYRNKIDTLEGIAWVRGLIDEFNPARVNIDAGNIGAAIVTGLQSIGPRYVDVVRGVNFGGTAEFKLATPKVPGPWNRRAEMWARMRDWLKCVEGAAIPDDDALQSDLTAPRMKVRISHDFLLESKEQMRARGVRSPDLGDSVALTFAFNEFFTDYDQPATVTTFGNIDNRGQAIENKHLPPAYGPHGWMA
jgi:hypothetical protein